MFQQKFQTPDRTRNLSVANSQKYFNEFFQVTNYKILGSPNFSAIQYITHLVHTECKERTKEENNSLIV